MITSYMRCRVCGEYIPREDTYWGIIADKIIRKCPVCGSHDLHETEFENIEKDRAEAKRYSTALRELYKLDALKDPVHTLEKMREFADLCGFMNDFDHYYDYEIHQLPTQ